MFVPGIFRPKCQVCGERIWKYDQCRCTTARCYSCGKWLRPKPPPFHNYCGNGSCCQTRLSPLLLWIDNYKFPRLVGFASVPVLPSVIVSSFLVFRYTVYAIYANSTSIPVSPTLSFPNQEAGPSIQERQVEGFLYQRHPNASPSDVKKAAKEITSEWNKSTK
jgi:hypothetical protein